MKVELDLNVAKAISSIVNEFHEHEASGRIVGRPDTVLHAMNLHEAIVQAQVEEVHENQIEKICWRPFDPNDRSTWPPQDEHIAGKVSEIVLVTMQFRGGGLITDTNFMKNGEWFSPKTDKLTERKDWKVVAWARLPDGRNLRKMLNADNA